jgi:flavin reductase (DIM6/NTAB) family NADH-FMN oxidoreductase RutF
MYINLSELSEPQVYFTMTQTIIPRPIAWVLSENENSSFNLAPFSYFNAVCSDPPLVMISVGKKPDGSYKDTLVNIETRSDFVVHIVSRGLIDPMNQSSATLPAGESELDITGLPTAAMPGCRLPRLADSPIAFACERYEIHKIGGVPQSLILGRISGIHLDDGVVELDDKGRTKVNAERVDPLGRLGASEYVSFGEKIRLSRPS